MVSLLRRLFASWEPTLSPLGFNARQAVRARAGAQMAFRAGFLRGICHARGMEYPAGIEDEEGTRLALLALGGASLVSDDEKLPSPAEVKRAFWDRKEHGPAPGLDDEEELEEGS